MTNTISVPVAKAAQFTREEELQLSHFRDMEGEIPKVDNRLSAIYRMKACCAAVVVSVGPYSTS
jgi:hypothetical protein